MHIYSVVHVLPRLHSHTYATHAHTHTGADREAAAE